MERVIQLAIFVSILFAILFLMHLYSFVRLCSLFGLDRKAWHYLILVLLSSSLILSTILCRISYNPVTKSLYTLAACWFGIIFILFAVLVLFEVPRLLFRIQGPAAGTAIIAFVAIVSIASIINAFFVRVKTVEVPSFGEELNAAVLSDIHIGTIWGKDNLNKIVETTNALKPDVVFILGDVVSGGAVLREDVLTPLGDLQAADPQDPRTAPAHRAHPVAHHRPRSGSPRAVHDDVGGS